MLYLYWKLYVVKVSEYSCSEEAVNKGRPFEGTVGLFGGSWSHPALATTARDCEMTTYLTSRSHHAVGLDASYHCGCTLKIKPQTSDIFTIHSEPTTKQCLSTSTTAQTRPVACSIHLIASRLHAKVLLQSTANQLKAGNRKSEWIGK
jgi:hypothetical protein